MSNGRDAHKFEISLGMYSDGHTQGMVKLDGKELRNVRALTISAGASQLTEVTLTLLANADVRIAGAKLVEKIEGHDA